MGQAIAEGQLEVGEPFRLSPTQIKALEKAIDSLKDNGDIAGSQILTGLILERGELAEPARQNLLLMVSQHDQQGWRMIIQGYINSRQPFQVLYENAQDQKLIFTVRCAQFSFYEKRFYLDIWCDETEDISPEDQKDFPELIHNRCLRLDRIKAIVPLEGEWRDGIDLIEVQLHFKGEMVKAYEGRLEDIKDETVDGTRIVTRKITNYFWLVREALRYGDNCNVVTPESIRQRIYTKLIKLLQNYSPDFENKS
ncbi:MAG: hypothetical protein RLZZ148_2700 [Cyanobacteriota bacterium]